MRLTTSRQLSRKMAAGASRENYIKNNESIIAKYPSARRCGKISVRQENQCRRRTVGGHTNGVGKMFWRKGQDSNLY